MTNRENLELDSNSQEPVNSKNICISENKYVSEQLHRESERVYILKIKVAVR